ncbi:MAG: DJ-1/PfpI family protein [Aquincola tertiaricarbonis]|uniref:DJ-1/PfpI family protein n=1 Tax=Aquincola TaxID=391952 RepID=UPI0006150A61|nr:MULTISPECIES: DJ-1/PfpI family protein [Aquincola]MCR5864238.1 DJ-1/PfpI family protein [Aquincola sp. J276]
MSFESTSRPVATSHGSASPGLQAHALLGTPRQWRVAMLIDDGVDELCVARLIAELDRAGAQVQLVAPQIAPVSTQLGGMLSPEHSVAAVSAADFDAVCVPSGLFCAETLQLSDEALSFVQQAYEAGKTLAATGEGVQVLRALGLPVEGGDALDEPEPGVIVGHGEHCTLSNFGRRLAKRLSREPQRPPRRMLRALAA